MFCDVQRKGPFAFYRHEHRMESIDSKHSVLVDRVTFAMPFGWIGSLLGRLVMMPKLARLFAFRHEVTRKAFV